MSKPRKAYLLAESHEGFGFRVSPVLVLDHDPKTRTARIAFLNVSRHSAWIPTAGIGLTVDAANLASTRTKALAKIAVRLHDLETALAAHLALPAPERAPAPAPAVMTSGPATPAPQPTPGGPRRPNRRPWWQEA